MTWNVEYTDEFGDWWANLTEDEQEALDSSVRLLEARGPGLGYPHSSGINGSRHKHMRELRKRSINPSKSLSRFVDQICYA
jgi:hypothetical protein